LFYNANDHAGGRVKPLDGENANDRHEELVDEEN
jgi:hypothetical protein